MLLTKSFKFAATVRLRAAFSDDQCPSSPVDPDSILVKVLAPGDTGPTSYTYGVDAGVVKESVGCYRFDVFATTRGTYSFRWEGTGTYAAVDEGQFKVQTSEFDV